MSAAPSEFHVESLTAPWGGQGKWADLGGPVFYADFGGPAGAPVLLLVHGLGGSHLNWALIAQPLARHYRVLALDLIGFGLTRAEGRDSTVGTNSRLVSRFIDEVVGEPVVLVGNSMGGLITTMVAAATPELVRGAILVNPALPQPLKRPDLEVASGFLVYLTPLGGGYLGRMKKRTTPAGQVERTLKLCFADWTRMDPELFEASVDLAAERRKPAYADADHWFLTAARSLLRKNSRPRAARARSASIDKPVLLIHGDLDRLVPVEAADLAARTHASWDYVRYEGIGHVPMLECPDETVADMEAWLGRHFPTDQT
ncbi:MAG: alpha/beta hydrolase [Micrococcales bacterium]|nr:alpha/beta hydrolase [Micrococcales bacterium]